MVIAVVQKQDTSSQIVDVAMCLFRQVGFQKTTVADIARELQMSPANVYRFFTAKSEITDAVAGRLLCEIESAIREASIVQGSARENLRNVVATIDRLNSQRFYTDRKLHNLLETAYNENWTIVRKHTETVEALLTQIILQGIAAAEFERGDPHLLAVLVRSSCLRFCHPRVMAERAEEPEPTVDQTIDFCLNGLLK